jgi:alpha-glucosidase
MHEYIQEMQREVFDKYKYCMTVGELGFTKDAESVRKYVDPIRRELNCLFAGDIVDMDFGPSHKYEAGQFKLEKLREITRGWQKLMPTFDGWNTIYMDNHDSGRSLSRYGSDKPEFRARAAKMLAMHLCSLSGSLFMLQGQEIGMANCPREWGIEEYVDVEARNYYNKVLEQRGKGADMSDVMQELRKKARDNGRLPMQWNAASNGGFTTGKSWMRVNDDYEDWNVESQDGKHGSVLEFWRHMLDLRKKEKDVFVYGRWEEVPAQESGEDVFAYTMTSGEGEKALVLLNFSEEEHIFDVQTFTGWKKLVGESQTEAIGKQGVPLKGYEGVIYCDWIA